MATCSGSQSLGTLVAGMSGSGGCCPSGCSSTNEGDEKSSDSVEEEEEDDQENEQEDEEETMMVMTCEGNISDPQLHNKLSHLMHHLQCLTHSDRVLEVRAVEPWNSVRVTFSIPREAARRLHLLAQAGEPALRHLGILSVQVQGDQVVSLRLAGHNNESNEVMLRPTDGPVSGNVMDRLSGIIGIAATPSSHPHHPSHPVSHQPHHPTVQPATVQYRATGPPPHAGPSGFSSYPPQQSIGRNGPLQQPGTLLVRSPNTAALLHHRPAPPPPPPPYPVSPGAGCVGETLLHHPHHLQNAVPVSSSYLVQHTGEATAITNTYRLTSAAVVNQQPGLTGGIITATGRQMVVRPPPPVAQQQQILQHQQQQSVMPAAVVVSTASTGQTVSTTVGNVVKNSPLLVGLLQQPDQMKSGVAQSNPELGLASTHLTNLAANHYTVNNHPPTVHHRQMVNSSSISQYSSSTRSKDGLTTHQQVYSGGSVITNARVPVPGGLQQHPQATGKPPPIVGSLPSSQLPITSTVVQASSLLPPTVVTNINRHSVQQQPQHHLPQQTASVQQPSVFPQRSVSANSALVNASARASPSPTISPTPSIPSPHAATNSSLPTVSGSCGSQTMTTVPGIQAFSSCQLTALTPLLTSSSHQKLPVGSNVHSSSSSSNSVGGVSSLSDASSVMTQIDPHVVTSASMPQISTSQAGVDTKSTKAASPKMVGSKESQYLINPNTGLLEPRPNTDSSDSDSDLRSSSPPHQKVSAILTQQAISKASCSPLYVKQQQQDKTESVASAGSKLHSHEPIRTLGAAQILDEVASTTSDRNNGSSCVTPAVASVSEGVPDWPTLQDSSANGSGSTGMKDVSLTTAAAAVAATGVQRLVSGSGLVQSDRGLSRQKEDQPTSNTNCENRIVRSAGTGELRLKFKLGREQLTQKTITPNIKKIDKKDMVVSGKSSSLQTSSEQRVPKLHIKFGSISAPIIIKPQSEEKERNKRIGDKGREERKRKGNRKRSRISDCESDRLEILKLKSSSSQESPVLKIGDLKKAKMEHESDDSVSYRCKESGDIRSKGTRTFDDKYSGKVDSLKMAKFDSKLRNRPKVKNPLRKVGSINNFGELTSHKILETLPPSITKVAAMHTQQPHRNPSSTSSGTSYFTSDSSSLLDSDILHSSSSSSSKDLNLSSSGGIPSISKSGLMNGDLSHAERGALSRTLQSSTFSELTAVGKLTIKRKGSAGDHHIRSSTSLSLLKKEASHAADSKRKIGGLSCIPTYLNSSVLINKVSSLDSSSTGYARLHDTDRGRSSTAGGGKGGAGKGGQMLKTALCANFPSLNANSDITIQSVRKKDVLQSRLSGTDDQQLRGAPHGKGPGQCSLPDGVNKSGRVTCIDVTDRKAVEEAVKSSRNSSSNTDSQQKIVDKLERWNCGTTVVSTASSSHVSTSALTSNNLTTRLQPDSTKYFPSSLSVESKDASEEIHGKVASSPPCPVEQPPRDSDAGNIKSHVKSSLVNSNNCDTRVKSDAAASPTELSRSVGSSGGCGAADDCSGKVEAGSSSSGGNVTLSKQDIESPEGTPKGEHGAGQGGEDSGIESMDALSEKSPNQSDQSPHRRDDKECESVYTPAASDNSSGLAGGSNKMLVTTNSCRTTVGSTVSVVTVLSSSTVVSSHCATNPSGATCSTSAVVTPTTAAASSIVSSKKNSVSLETNGLRQCKSSVSDAESLTTTRLKDSQSTVVDKSEKKWLPTDTVRESKHTNNNTCDVYQYDIEKEAPEDIRTNVSLKDKEGRLYSEESQRKRLQMIDPRDSQTKQIKSYLNQCPRKATVGVQMFSEFSGSLGVSKVSSLTRNSSILTSSAPSSDISVSTKRVEGAIVLTPSGKEASFKSKPVLANKLNSRIINSSDTNTLQKEENCLDQIKAERNVSPILQKVSASTNNSTTLTNSSIDSYNVDKKIPSYASHNDSDGAAGSDSSKYNNVDANSYPVPVTSTESSFNVVSSNSNVGSTAMMFLPNCSSGSTTTGSSVSTAKVVTLKSSSFTSSSSSNLGPPVGKAFRLVSLPENMAMSPSSSPVKGQLVTLKQVVPSSGSGSLGATRASSLLATTNATNVTTKQMDDCPPSLLKAQLLAPTNAHHSFAYVGGVQTTASSSPLSVSSTNGESENLDFVGFSTSSITKLNPSVTRISQIITPEKDEKNLEILSPTEDEPKPLRVQPPLYTYGSNKDRKKDLDTDTDDKDKVCQSNTPEKYFCNNIGIKLELTNKDNLEQKLSEEIQQASKSKCTEQGFEVLTIEIPATGTELMDDKRLTRATRQSARLASPKVNSPTIEVSPRAGALGSDRRSPGGYSCTAVTANTTLSSLASTINVSVATAITSLPAQNAGTLCSSSFSNSVSSLNPTISSLAHASISGRVLANSGSITVTSLSSSRFGSVSPATRGANKRKRHDSEGEEVMPHTSDVGIGNCKTLRRKVHAGLAAAPEQTAAISVSAGPTPHFIADGGKPQQQLGDQQQRYTGDQSSDDDDEDSDGVVGEGKGVVVIGVASCLAEAAAAAAAAATAVTANNTSHNSAATSTASAVASTPTTVTTKRRHPSTASTTSTQDDDEETRPSSRSSRAGSTGRRSRECSTPSGTNTDSNIPAATTGQTTVTTTRAAAAAAAAAVLPDGETSTSISGLTCSSSISSTGSSSISNVTSDTITITAAVTCNTNSSISGISGRPDTPTRRSTVRASQAVVRTSTPDGTSTSNSSSISTGIGTVCGAGQVQSSVPITAAPSSDKEAFAGNAPPATAGVTAASVKEEKSEVKEVGLRETRGAVHNSKVKVTSGAATAAAALLKTTNNNNNKIVEEIDVFVSTPAATTTSVAAAITAISSASSDNRRKTRSAAAVPEDIPNKRRRISKDK